MWSYELELTDWIHVLGVPIYMQCAMYTYLLYLSNKDPESENKTLMTWSQCNLMRDSEI